MEDQYSTDAVELIVYLRVLWRQKWIIALTFLAAVITVWVLSDIPDPKYRVSASLLLLPPLASELNVDTSTAAWAPEMYKQLASSTKVLQSVIAQLSLSPGVQSAPSTSRLRESMAVDVTALSSMDSRSSDYDPTTQQILLTLSMTDLDPTWLSHVIEVWIEAFSETFELLFQDRTARSYAYVSQNASDTAAELEGMLAQQKLLLLETPIDSLRSYHGWLLLQLNVTRTDLANARRTLSTTMTRVSALERERALQPLTYELLQSVSPDSLIGIASELSAREIETLASIQVRNEQLNSTYVQIDSRISTSRAEIQALEEDIRYLELSEPETALLLQEVAHELVEAESALRGLEREIALLESSYVALREQLQTARIALAETPSPIQIIDEPFVPDAPISPQKSSNVAIAGFLGLMLGTLLAFFLDYLQRVREREKEAQAEAAQNLPQPDHEDIHTVDQGNDY